MNIVMAMNMGADDFVAKPFDLTVLTAKVQAMLRRGPTTCALQSAAHTTGVPFWTQGRGA